MAITHGGNIFAVAREHGWDWREVLDFSASINPLGPAPGVCLAIREAVERIVHYPERDSPKLCAALSQTWDVEADQIMAGNGATELIFFLARLFAGEQVALALPVFSEFERAFPNAEHVNLQRAETWPDEGVLVLTRPANPTGWTLPLDALESWLASHAATVIVDESFLDFSRAASAMSLIQRYPNLIVLRSLTKFYALPGLRIGAVVSSAANVRRWCGHREPWQVNVIAEQAALAALRDVVHARNSRLFVETERAWLTRELAAIDGNRPCLSDANFIHVHLESSAAQLCEHLLQHKILIRNCGESVRIAVRLRHENERLLSAWRTFQCD